MVEEGRLCWFRKLFCATGRMEAIPTFDRRAAAVKSEQWMLPVPLGAHRESKLFAQRLEIKRVPARLVVRRPTGIVIEKTGAYNPEAFIQRCQIFSQRHSPGPMREFVGVEIQPPDVLIALRKGHLGDNIIHMTEAQPLIVPVSPEGAPEYRPFPQRRIHCAVCAAVIHQVDALAALCQRVADSGYYNVFLHPGSQHREHPEVRQS